MTQHRFELLALGNAIVDVLTSVEDDVLVRERLPKGTMSLIDEMRAESLCAIAASPAWVSGGSAANTAVGFASLGGRAAFIGKVRDDSVGDEFCRDIRDAGVHFETSSSKTGPATARCMVLVTPDGERTMATFLGACQNLTVDDIDSDLVERSDVLYLEGYLWDPPHAKDAFRKAARIAHGAGGRVALSLSDPFCVDRYRDEFIELVKSRDVDILFANQHEIKSLFQTADLETAIEATRATHLLSVVTRSEDGCSVLTPDERIDIPARRVDRVVDATGAGDLFAAGFLFGLSRRLDFGACGRLGALAASEAISHFGARPDENLSELARRVGLLP